MTPTRSGQFIVRWRHFPVRFAGTVHFDRTVRGVRQVFSLVEPEEATRFASQADAARSCREHNLKLTESRSANPTTKMKYE